ncbi:MAG: septal ring lytic transglycosylase RlpA family protein [Spirochaetales bacterium]|nr:septal ring lytic transglycosylase RlpA family protein [Spirochaetales bacterium]
MIIFCAAMAIFADTAAHTETGMASWYGGKFQGRQTASGEIFDTNLMTAAHKTLPFGTIVKVVNLDNELETTVKINDRGPFVTGRIIDLSRAAADEIKMVGAGVARVQISVVSTPARGETSHKNVPSTGTAIIQVGAYGSRENALNSRNTLVRNGFEAELEPAGNITRVVLKGIMLGDLDNVLTRLRAVGITSPLVRRTR